MGNTRAVLFDVYGTLVRIARPQRPFRRLVDEALAQGCPITREQAARTIMCESVDMAGAAKRLGLAVTDGQLGRWQSMLDDELASIEPFPETVRVLTTLRERGYRLGLCSNLAAPYVRPVESALGHLFDQAVWSCAVGAIKPDPRIYAAAVAGFGVPASQVLMVGDTPADDVAGAQRAGLQALWLDRSGKRGQLHSLDMLLGLLP